MLEMVISSNFRQLLLQAYCTLETYGDNEVHIMLIVGIYFTLFKFNRPGDSKPIPQEPGPKRQKFGTGDSSTGQPKRRTAKDIDDSELAKLIPPECTSVLFPNAPVFVDAQDWDLQLSDAFRLALNGRLDKVSFQPCSLFDLRGAQYTPDIIDSVRPSNTFSLLVTRRFPQSLVEKAIANWYATAETEGGPKTPKPVRPNGFYYESPVGAEESPETPGYKGRAVTIGIRQSLPRAAKIEIGRDLFTLAGRQGNDEELGIGESSGTGNVSGDLQEGFGDEDFGESGEESWCRKGKRKAADM